MGKVVGEITCPMCEKTAEARQETRGSKCYYIGCDRCGILQPRRFEGQVWMRKHMVLFDDQPSPKEPDKPPVAEPETKPKPEPKKGIWESLWSEDDD